MAAHKPVQIALICYVNQQGKLDTIVPFIDDLTFAEHVRRVLEMPPVTAHLMALPAISVEGHTLESLTAEVQQAMVNGLAELHQNVLKLLLYLKLNSQFENKKLGRLSFLFSVLNTLHKAF